LEKNETSTIRFWAGFEGFKILLFYGPVQYGFE